VETGWLPRLSTARNSGAAEGEGQEARSSVFTASGEDPISLGEGSDALDGTSIMQPDHDDLYKTLVDIFIEIEAKAQDGQPASKQLPRVQEENQLLRLENDRRHAMITTLQSELAALRRLRQVSEDTSEEAEVVEKRPHHDLEPHTSILRSRRVPEPPKPSLLKRRAIRKQAARPHQSAQVATTEEDRGRISWEEMTVEEDEIESFRSEELCPQLWHESFNVECNRCERTLQWRHGADFSTLAGAPGRSRFAQWQIVCKDCVAKENFAKFGAMEVLRRSVVRGNTEHLEECMFQVMDNLAHIVPIDDVLMRLIRTTNNSNNLKLPGQSPTASEHQMRRAIICRAAQAFRKQPASGRRVVMRRPAAAGRSARQASSSRSRMLLRRPAAAAKAHRKKKKKKGKKTVRRR
jgi:hypothetical protein